MSGVSTKRVREEEEASSSLPPAKKQDVIRLPPAIAEEIQQWTHSPMPTLQPDTVQALLATKGIRPVGTEVTVWRGLSFTKGELDAMQQGPDASWKDWRRGATVAMQLEKERSWSTDQRIARSFARSNQTDNEYRPLVVGMLLRTTLSAAEVAECVVIDLNVDIENVRLRWFESEMILKGGVTYSVCIETIWDLTRHTTLDELPFPYVPIPPFPSIAYYELSRDSDSEEEIVGLKDYDSDGELIPESKEEEEEDDEDYIPAQPGPNMYQMLERRY